MKSVVRALFHAIHLLAASPALLVLYVGFLLLRWLASTGMVPWYVELVLLMLALGWLGAKFWFLSEAVTRNYIDWSRLPGKLRLGFEKLLPLMLYIGAVVVLPLLILIVIFGAWFAGVYMSRATLEVSQQEVWQSLIPAVFNPVIWYEFVNQNWLTWSLFQLWLLFGVVLSLLLRLIIIKLMIGGQTHYNALMQSVAFILAQKKFVVAFVVLQLVSNFSLGLAGWVLPQTVGKVHLVLSDWGFILMQAVVLFILDAFVLLYLERHGHHNLPSLGGRSRWWRR